MIGQSNFCWQRRNFVAFYRFRRHWGLRSLKKFNACLRRIVRQIKTIVNIRN